MKMKSFCRRRCFFIVYLMMTPVYLQIPMGPVGYPMPMPPPMFAMPAPPPMPVGVPVPIPMIFGNVGGMNGNGKDQRNAITTTTTTTVPPNNKEVIQIPLPVEISIYPNPNRYPRFYPAPYPGPPPAPFPPPAAFPGPYAAPAYGMPLPMPMMPPPPLVVLPNQNKPRRERKPDDSDESCERKKPKCRHRKRRQFRRMLRSEELHDNELVKPVLTYVSRNGDVKLKKKLSNDEAADLMDDEKSFQKYSVIAGEDSNNKPRVLVVSNNERSYDNRNHQRRQVILRTGSSNHGLGEGRKELVFRPPGDKRISNLSVSFQISDR